MPHLIYSIDDGLATLVLTDPPQNRIDPQMATELAEALEAIGDSNARAVPVRSEGPDFSFGGDIVDWPDADVRRARAAEWALTSEQVPARVMAEAGVVNRVVCDDALPAEATALARKAAKGPTRAYGAHNSLLRAWAVGGVSAADELIFDIAMPLFETDDVKAALASAVRALKAGLPRPALDFRGR